MEDAVLLLAYIVLALPVAAVNGLKGKWGMALLSLLGPAFLFTIPSAIRLARPDSWWSRRFYDQKQLAAAKDRRRPMESRKMDSAGAAFTVQCSVCGEQFESSERAAAHIQASHPQAATDLDRAVETLAAPGWYPHPDDPATEWFWDGEEWTESRRPHQA